MEVLRSRAEQQIDQSGPRAVSLNSEHAQLAGEEESISEDVGLLCGPL